MMTLTPETRAIGRRNFLKAIAATPALATLNQSATQGRMRGEPVRLGMIGVGGQGRALLGNVDASFGRIVAMADINPDSLTKADDVLARRRQPAARHYTEWRDMLEHENVEAVIVAVPLWAHADVVVPCLEAGKHVLCEKMMAFDVAGCDRMKAAAIKANRLLEIGYQRYYSPVYQAAYDGVIARHLLGDVYHARLSWARNGNWRREAVPPSRGYDPSPWGYPTFEHLANWRLYWQYSRGLFAELCSHQLNATHWFLGTGAPTAVHGSGGVYRYKDGRESHDHVYGIFEYPSGLTVTFSSVESNAHDQRYEAFYGTKATLIMHNETEALLFDETTGDARQTSVEVSGGRGGAAVEASETKAANNQTGGRRGAAPQRPASAPAGPDETARSSALENEIAALCSAIRTGAPLRCGPDRAMESARACIAACEAARQRTRLMV